MYVYIHFDLENDLWGCTCTCTCIVVDGPFANYSKTILIVFFGFQITYPIMCSTYSTRVTLIFLFSRLPACNLAYPGGAPEVCYLLLCGGHDRAALNSSVLTAEEES